MISLYGVVKKILGGCPGGEFYTADGKCRAKIILEEDQSYDKKDGTHVEKMVEIPISFWGDSAEKANDEKYLGQQVKVDVQLGGWNPEADKWYPNITGIFMHGIKETKTNKKETDEIAF